MSGQSRRSQRTSQNQTAAPELPAIDNAAILEALEAERIRAILSGEEGSSETSSESSSDGPRFGLNDAGLGVETGGWQIGVMPTMGEGQSSLLEAIQEGHREEARRTFEGDL